MTGLSGNGLTKDLHPWQQGINGAEYIIENVVQNDLVVDPFLVSGTTAVACKRLNRRFVGCDEDEAAVDTTFGRLAREQESTEARPVKNGGRWLCLKVITTSFALRWL